jgi:hypothetical protein
MTSASSPATTALDTATAGATDMPAVSQGVSIQVYEDLVPPFVESALEQLYGNLFSSLAHRRVFGTMQNASTYVMVNGTEVAVVWLFRREKNRIQVLNEGIRLTEEEATRFASYIFGAYRSVNVIAFHAVQAKMRKLPLPFQQFNCLEDMVLTLPRSTDDYLASLSKATRSYIHRYLNKLKRDFPSFRYEVSSGQDIGAEDIRAIIQFNHARMAGKGKLSINDDDTEQRIIRLAKECGLVGVITLDGKVCAGTINYRVGDNYFLDVIAHDPAYNAYRLGTVCCFLTACECIARGGNEYHLLWGQDEYKTRLRAIQRNLDDVVIYRSRTQMLANVGMVLQNALKASLRQARLWLRTARREERLSARLVGRVLHLVRSLGLGKS